MERIFDLQMQAMEDPVSVRQQAQKEHELLLSELESIFRVWENDQRKENLQRIEPLLARIKYINNLMEIKG